MARTNETLIGNVAYGAMGGQPNAANLATGGFFGWAPDFGNYLSDQGYVPKPLELVVIESPRFLNLMPNPEKWQAAFRNLIETKVIRAEGYNAGLTVSVDEHAAGGAGEMMQEPTDTKRARTEPVLNFIEKYGRPIQTFLDIWIRYGIMDPDTKFAMLTTLANGVPDDLLADWYSGTILAYECDPIHKSINKAWLTTNFYPMGTGEIVGTRDLTEAASLLRLSVPFSGISAVGNGINDFARQVMLEVNRIGADPYNRRAFLQDVAADVRAAAGTGLYNSVEVTGQQNVFGTAAG